MRVRARVFAIASHFLSCVVVILASSFIRSLVCFDVPRSLVWT